MKYINILQVKIYRPNEIQKACEKPFCGHVRLLKTIYLPMTPGVPILENSTAMLAYFLIRRACHKSPFYGVSSTNNNLCNIYRTVVSYQGQVKKI